MFIIVQHGFLIDKTVIVGLYLRVGGDNRQRCPALIDVEDVEQGRSKRSGWSGFGRTNNGAGRNFVLTAETTLSLFGVYSSATVLQQACSPPIVNNLKPFSLYFC